MPPQGRPNPQQRNDPRYQSQGEYYNQSYDQPQDDSFVDDKPRKRRGKRKKSGGLLKTVLQFVAGLVVIAVVAGAIVWLYLKYYQ